jgi:predicted membrane-bound spermidine synthase
VSPFSPQGLFTVAIFLSGLAALTYQVVWQRVLTQAIGADAVSAVLIVTIFMIWLGAGAELGRRLTGRSRFATAAFYAALEAVIAVCGVVSVPVLRSFNAWFAADAIGSVWIDFALNSLLLGPVVLAMGATTPLVIHAVRRQLSNLGRTVGLFYGANILGAASGALLAGLVLIEAVGLAGATWIAASCNAVAAMSALGASRGFVKAAGTPVSVPRSVVLVSLEARVAVLFGFGTLSLQMLFFRILGNYLTLVPAVFPIVLFAFLLLMAAGQALGGWLADRHVGRWPDLIACLSIAGGILLVAVMHVPSETAAAVGALRFTSFNGSLVPAQFVHLIGDPPLPVCLLFSLVLMLPVAAWSAIFPILLRIVTPHVSSAGGNFAGIYLLYAIGNVIGAWFTGIYLLPTLGTGGTARVTVLLVLAASLVLVWRDRARRKPASLYGGLLSLLAAALVCGIALPARYYESFRLGAYRVADVFEGRTGVATVVPTRTFYSIVDMNRTASASAMVRDPGPDDQYEAWRWNHTELMALDPDFRPRRVLVIGLGHAYLIDALLDFDFVEELVVVELSEEVLAAVKKHTRTATRRVFADPRVRIVVADGRRYIQSAVARGEKFDLVQIKINEPWHAGSGNLFTVEFFGLVKQLLASGGYLGVRPLLGHLSDGLRVFDNALYPGFYHLFFKNGAFALPEHGCLTPDIEAQWRWRLPGGRGGSMPRDSKLSVIFFEDLPKVLRTDTNSDDRPTFEYYWLRQRLGSWTSPRASLAESRFDPYRRTLTVLGVDPASSRPLRVEPKSHRADCRLR